MRERAVGIVGVLIFFLLVLSNYTSSKYSAVGVVALLALVFSVILFSSYSGCILLATSRIDSELFTLLLFFLLFIFLYLYSVTVVDAQNKELGIYRGMQIAIVYLCIYTFYLLGLNGKADFILRCLFYLIILLFVLFVLGAVADSVYRKFSGGLKNPNGFGMWVYALITLALAAKVSRLLKFVAVVLGGYLVFISSSRTALLATVVALFIYFFARGFFNKKWFSRLIFVFLLLTSFLIIAVTVSGGLDSFNEDVVNVTGKNLKSGRHLIWPIVLEEINSNPVWGLGAGIELSDISDFNYSVHNYFLQLCLQVGYSGLIVFILLLLKVFDIVSNSRGSSYYQAVFSSICGLIVIQNFEITLMQNNMALSLPIWAAVGLVYGDSKFISKSIGG